jgi:hypothetical protein
VRNSAYLLFYALFSLSSAVVGGECKLDIDKANAGIVSGFVSGLGGDAARRYGVCVYVYVGKQWRHCASSDTASAVSATPLMRVSAGYEWTLSSPCGRATKHGSPTHVFAAIVAKETDPQPCPANPKTAPEVLCNKKRVYPLKK